jgi:hypothetical protein
MVDVLMLLWSALAGLFRSRARLEAEILALRQQINVLRSKSRRDLLSAISTVWCLFGFGVSFLAL